MKKMEEARSGKKKMLLPLRIVIFLIGFQRFQVTVGITTTPDVSSSSDSSSSPYSFAPVASLPISLPLSSPSSSSQSVFEGETLSPRTVNTKYGILRGTLIYTRNSYDKSSGNFFSSSSSPSSPSSKSSSAGYSSTVNKNQDGSSSGETVWKSVEVFLGVPYATAPIGSLRFMPPVTPTHWRGVRLANKLSHVCPQKFPPELKQYLSYPGSSSSSSRSTGRPSSSASGSSSFSSSSSSHQQKPEGGPSGGGSRTGHLVRMAPFLRNHSEDCLYLNIYAPFTSNPSSSSSPSPSSTSSSSFSSSTFSSSSTSSTGHGGGKGKQQQLLPVVVFILGDSFDWGSGNSYDGTILASFGNVIVITLNYRLGVFGFLPSFVDGSPRGNYGLMDQVAALHWVQENIKEFGGDPTNVTLAGHGHGAACVHLLMMSPMASTSLFTRAIVMSGSALSPWAIARESETHAKTLGKAVNCLTSDSAEMTDCLRGKRADELLDVDLKVPDFLTSFGPIIDGIVVMTEPKESVLNPDGSVPDHLRSQSSSTGISSLTHGDPRIPTTPLVPFDLLFGITKVETPAIFTPMEERQGIDAKRRDRILRTLVRNLFDYHQQVIFLTLINEYSDWSRPSDHPINLIESLSDILSDGLVVSPLLSLGDSNSRLATAQSSPNSGRGRNHFSPLSPSTFASSPSSYSSQILPVGSSNTRSYFYVFSYQGKEEVSFASSTSSTSSSSFSSSSRSGCIHGDEIPFLFGAPLSNDLMPFRKGSFGHFSSSPSTSSSNYSRTESTLSEAVMMYWTNFVKFGDPNIWPHELFSSGDRTKTRFENVYWPQYDAAQRRYLMIGMKPKVRDHYHSHRMSYWLNLFPHLQSTSESLITKSFLDSDDRPSSSSPESTASYYYYKHHLLPDHENPSTYDGIVREISLRFFDPPSFPSSSSSSSAHPSFNTSFTLSKNHWNKSSLQSSGQMKQGSINTRVQVNGSNDGREHLSGSSSRPSSNPSFSNPGFSNPGFSSPGVTQMNPGSINKSELATPISMEVQPGSYSTALTITITIGVSLLILNMLLFFGLYYHMDRRKESPQGSNRQGNQDQNNGNEDSDHVHHLHTQSTSNRHHHHAKNRNRNTVTFNEKLDNSDELMILKQDPFMVTSPLTDLTNQNNSNEDQFNGMELDPYRQSESVASFHHPQSESVASFHHPQSESVASFHHPHTHLVNHFHHRNHHQHSPLVMDTTTSQVYDVNNGSNSINDNDRNSFTREGRALIVSTSCDPASNPPGLLSYVQNHHSSSSSSPSQHHTGYCSNGHPTTTSGYVTTENGQVVFLNGQPAIMEQEVQRSVVRTSMDGLMEEINT